jgi:hypothetical protein
MDDHQSQQQPRKPAPRWIWISWVLCAVSWGWIFVVNLIERQACLDGSCVPSTSDTMLVLQAFNAIAGLALAGFNWRRSNRAKRQ